MSSTLRVERVGLPTQLQDILSRALQAGRESRRYRYVRARALTSLRHKLSAICHARLCLGGRRKGSEGRYPGVIEEALLALRNDKPLYLSGLLGGASQQLIEAIKGRPMPSDFGSAVGVEKLYLDAPFLEADETTTEDRTINREAVWEEFTSVGLVGVAERAHLTTEETNELIHTRVIDRVIELMLVGLSRIGAQK